MSYNGFNLELERSYSHRSYEKKTPREITPPYVKPHHHGSMWGSFKDDVADEESKMDWLRSQLIGDDVEFDTPFGKRRLTYADHTASGRSVRYIEEYVTQKVLPYYGNTHTDDSHVGHMMSKMVHDAANYVKKCMGGRTEDVLLFCGSGATAAIKRLQEVTGLAVPSILRERMLQSLLREEERWVVFVGPYEHHSNVLSWRQSLAELVEIGMDDDGLVDIDSLKRELSQPRYKDRPKLGSFSACSNVTGIHADTRSLARILHRHGAFACFDFAASGPYEEINMRSGEEDGYDAVFLSPHKFLGGPGTPGVLLMNKALYLLNKSPPSTCGGGTVSYVNGFSEKHTLYYENVEEREDAGTPQITQKIRTALTFWVKEYIGPNLIDLHERLYTEAALKRLQANPNIHVLGNTRVKRQPVISFLIFPQNVESNVDRSSSSRATTSDHRGRGGIYKKNGMPLHGRFVTRLLNDLFGIQARGGCACAGPYGHRLLGVSDDLSLALRSAIKKGYEGLKPGWTRVSFSYYMSKEEFAFVLAAIEFVAEHGHRFLPLYHFDWKSGNWSFRKRTIRYQMMREELANALGDFSISDGVPSESSTIPSPRHASSPKGVMVWPLEGLDADAATPSGGGRNGGKSRFLSYMEAAKSNVKVLPETPAPRKIPEDVDLSLILFRI